MGNLKSALSIFVVVTLFSIASQAEGQSQKVPANGWGRFKVLETPQIRLTFLVQSAYLESVERDLDQAPKLSKFLMGKLSISVEERKLAIKEYRQWWLEKEAEHIQKLESVPEDSQISSRNLWRKFSAQIDALEKKDGEAAGKKDGEAFSRRSRMLYVQNVLRSGFHDFTLAGFKGIEDLESERDFGKRLIGLTNILVQMTRDHDRLDTLASLSNLLLLISRSESVSESNRNLILPAAIRLSKKVESAARDAGKIDILNPASLIGGAVVFKTVGQLALKSPVVMSIIGAWSKTSGMTKAVGASVAGHGVVLSSVIKSESGASLEKKLDPESLEKGIGSSAKGILVRTNKVENDSISLDAARALAKNILYSPESPELALKYGELFAFGERLLVSEDIFNLSVRGFRTTDFLKIRNEVLLRFDRYMTKRGLKVVDAAALAILKAYVDEHIPQHLDGQPLVLMSTLRPVLRGNCVSRMLALTAMFYPAYLKYSDPNLKFGLMLWEDHVEAVLYQSESKMALSIHSLTPLSPNESPALVSPRILAAAFLYRSTSYRLFGVGFNYEGSAADTELYPKSRLQMTGSKYPDVNGSSDLTTSKIDRDPNPSPFISYLYANKVKVGDKKRQLDLQLSNDSAGNGLRDIRDLMSGLMKREPFDGLNQKSRQAISSRIDSTNPAAQVTDPFVTVLSTNEIGRLIPSRARSKFPLIFLRADEWSFIEPSASYLKHKATPYRDAADALTMVRSEAKALQAMEPWKALARGEVGLIADLKANTEFQFGLKDLQTVMRSLENFIRVNDPRDESEFPFRYRVRDLFEVLGVNDDYAAIKVSAEKALNSILADQSGRTLSEYLENANSLKNSDRVRHLQWLYLLISLNGDLEGYQRQFGRLEFSVQSKKSKGEEAAGEKVPIAQRQQESSGNFAPIVMTLRPALISRSSLPKPPQKVKVVVEPEVAILVLHYFSGALTESERLKIVAEIADSDPMSQTSLKFSSKFFGWMPGIDIHMSWQNELANAWIDLTQTACEQPQRTRGSVECSVDAYNQQRCVIRKYALPPSKESEASTKPSIKSKSCQFLGKVSGELIFDEISELFDRPGL